MIVALAGEYTWLIASRAPVAWSPSIMQCPSCQHDNAPEASFCANCGSALLAMGTTAPPAPPTAEAQVAAEEIPPPAATHAEASVRLSIFSAVVCLFILGLTASALLDSGRYHDSLYAEYQWVPIGLGVAATLWLTGRLRWTGRFPSALGLVLIIMGSIFSFVIDFLYGHSTRAVVLPSGLIGLGIGLLVPLALWRQLRYISVTGKVALVFGAVAGLGLGNDLIFNVGHYGSFVLVVLIALFIGLPSVLISPIVRLSRES